MWEPPPPSANSPDHSRHHRDEFQLCKSAFRLGEFDCCDGKTQTTWSLWDIIACRLFFSIFTTDSDSEEDEPQFYMASESDGKTPQSAPRPNHNLSLLSLTVIISKGRLQARTDKKVSHRPANSRTRGHLCESCLQLNFSNPFPHSECCYYRNYETIHILSTRRHFYILNFKNGKIWIFVLHAELKKFDVNVV